MLIGTLEKNFAQMAFWSPNDKTTNFFSLRQDWNDSRRMRVKLWKTRVYAPTSIKRDDQNRNYSVYTRKLSVFPRQYPLPPLPEAPRRHLLNEQIVGERADPTLSRTLAYPHSHPFSHIWLPAVEENPSKSAPPPAPRFTHCVASARARSCMISTQSRKARSRLITPFARAAGRVLLHYTRKCIN